MIGKFHNDTVFYGNTYIDNDYVFRWEDGRPLSPDDMSQKHPKLLKGSEKEKVRKTSCFPDSRVMVEINGFEPLTS